MRFWLQLIRMKNKCDLQKDILIFKLRKTIFVIYASF